MIEIIPGILEKDFDSISAKVEQVENLVDWVQIDILDNTLIKNDTYNNFTAFKSFTGRIQMEAHLMVDNPRKYIGPLIESDFRRLIAHAEAPGIREFLNEARKFEIEIGVALDGPSPLELVEPYLADVDCVLVMMYKAGASGQPFQPEQLPKIKKIHDEYPDLSIEVDGGIDKQTAVLVRENGATRLVSTSFLFWQNKDRINEAIEELQAL